MFNAQKTIDEIVEFVRIYFLENGNEKTKAIFGVSGGKDSSITGALLVKALGKERVLGVLMPNGNQYDIDVSKSLCETLEIDYKVVNIEDIVNSLDNAIPFSDKLVSNDVYKINTPARIRMSILYAISGMVGGRVANTCNLSEDYVGYATKFGDNAGDFSLLRDLTVSEVKEIGYLLLDKKFVDKVPEDGLCGMSDEEKLGFTYDILDNYIRNGICDEETKLKIDKMHKINLHKVKEMPYYRKG